MHEGIELQCGPWTLEETCLLDSVHSFQSATCVIPTYQNIASLYNFVVKTKRVVDLQLTATPKTLRQIRAKMEVIRKRQAALRNLYYGLAALDNQA